MSFQQGLSGLNATSKNLEVIGNNIANASTYGAKASRAEFADMYANAINGAGASTIGIGVNLSTVSQLFTQGNIVTTENPLDLAINGDGFFQLLDPQNTVTYSRNGQFKLDRDGYVINNNGDRLLGYPTDGTGTVLPGVALPIQLPTAGITPRTTSQIDLEMNLDSRAGSTLPATGPRIDFTDPTTYNNSTSLTVYDARGQDVALTYYFQRAAGDNWNVYITANGTPLGTDANGPTSSTTITFPATGGTPTAPVGTVSVDIPATTNALGAQTLPITGIQLDVSGATQYGAAFAVTNLSQDGYAPGQLVGMQFESNGVIMARYSNGQTTAAGQLEIARFRNPQGLTPLGGNGWARSFTSGDPIVGVPGSGNLGMLQSGALEESNIDLTAELVSMMTAQRSYQANAQTIRTQDEVMQTLVNLR